MTALLLLLKPFWKYIVMAALVAVIGVQWAKIKDVRADRDNWKAASKGWANAADLYKKARKKAVDECRATAARNAASAALAAATAAKANTHDFSLGVRFGKATCQVKPHA